MYVKHTLEIEEETCKCWSMLVLLVKNALLALVRPYSDRLYHQMHGRCPCQPLGLRYGQANIRKYLLLSPSVNRFFPKA